MRDRAAEQPRDRVPERVRDRVAERVRDTEQLRESGREKERKRAVRVLGSARVLELGFRKITMLPLKNVKINKTGAFSCFGLVSNYRPV